MSSSISILVIVLLLAGSIYLRRRPEPAAAGLRLLLSLTAMAIALWGLWSTIQDHRREEAPADLSAAGSPVGAGPDLASRP